MQQVYRIFSVAIFDDCRPVNDTALSTCYVALPDLNAFESMHACPPDTSVAVIDDFLELDYFQNDFRDSE